MSVFWDSNLGRVGYIKVLPHTVGKLLGLCWLSGKDGFLGVGFLGVFKERKLAKSHIGRIDQARGWKVREFPSRKPVSSEVES